MLTLVFYFFGSLSLSLNKLLFALKKISSQFHEVLICLKTYLWWTSDGVMYQQKWSLIEQELKWKARAAPELIYEANVSSHNKAVEEDEASW